jgi:signal recognition particle subunit SRP54
MMDSMRDAELDGKVDWHNKTGTTDKASLDKRIRRIATGSGCHPTEVRMLLIAHKQFEGVVHKMKGLTGNKQQAAQQKQMAAQWRKNPQLMQQHLNKMDPKVIQQMGGRDQVMTVMQQMARGGGGPGGAAGGGMPDLSALMGGMGGGMPGMGGGGMPGMGGGGGMPDMQQLQAMMQQMGGGGGMPGMGGGGGMPDMQQLQAMMQQMGGGGGMPGMGGDGGMPDMEAMMRGMNMGKR